MFGSTRAGLEHDQQLYRGTQTQQFMLGGALNRMLKRAVARAWEMWQQTYVDLKFAKRPGGGAIKRMVERKLSMAFKWQCTARN